MLHTLPHQPGTQAQPHIPTYVGSNLTLQVRVNASPCGANAEPYAHELAARRGWYIHGSIIGLVVRDAETDRVIAEGLRSFDEAIAAIVAVAPACEVRDRG